MTINIDISQNAFWLGALSLVAGVLCTAIIGGLIYKHAENELIVKANCPQLVALDRIDKDLCVIQSLTEKVNP